MRKSLLEITQSILASMDGEEINSIGDTVESLQIVGYIKSSYEEIIASLHLPKNKTLFELNPSNDPIKPTVMYLPDTIQNIEWLKYDNSTAINNYGYRDLVFIEPADFLRTMYSDNELSYGDVGKFTLQTDTGTFDFFYRNNRMPTCYTSYDDRTLIFDSYDASVDNTLMANKTSGYGERVEIFRQQDSFVPNLPADLFPLLENEAKAQAFVEQKQSQNPTAEKRARKGWIRSQNDKVNVDYPSSKLNSITNYARSGPGYYNVRRYLRNGR